ncbi:hypothetical protein ABGB12_21335 [Actinocorallia sp. B10E7]|uniref:hypothetical protein n=1 Tax=Actinocorallia sp. B10E7 TaxID=3153558 RepID=UPI00325F24EF
MTLEHLAAQYPGWRLWHSRTGGLVCATRLRHLTEEELSAELHMTLMADDLPALAEELHTQTAREAAL